MAERVPVASDYGRVSTLSKRKLPCIVFAKAPPSSARSPLQLGALGCVLESNTLGDVSADEFHPPLRVVAAFQKLRRRNAAHEQCSLPDATIPAQPGHRRTCDAGADLALEVDQERGIKQHGCHGGPFGMRSSPVRPPPNPPVREW